MASSDVDQKYLGRIAEITAHSNPLASKALYQILGLSVLLARKLFRARRLRKLDTSRDTKSLQLYHHIIWLSREGLSLLEVCVLPYTLDGQQGVECQVLTAKLRASFCHIFCLFNNNPPITQATNLVPSSATPQPLSPKVDNGQRRERHDSTASIGKETTPKRNSRGKQPSLRDPIASITSEASFLTNPYAGIPPGTTPPPGLMAPPGLSAVAVPHPSSFLLPAINFVPLTLAHFNEASEIAADSLPGAHPLRLSVAVEHAAFLWDCVHDHEASRQMARRSIRELRQHEDEGVTDEMFEDAAELVGVLGRMMRRRSWEGTPKSGAQVASSLTSTAGTAATAAPPPQFPPISTLAEEAGPVNLYTASEPLTPAPTAPLPSTPRRIKVYRDENLPGLTGGPVGGVTPRANSSSRRGSRNGHGHKRGMSNGGQETIGPLRTPKEQTPPRPPPKPKADVRGKSVEGSPRTPPRQTPSGRSPEGGRSRAGTGSSSKKTTPKQKTADKLERVREKERVRAHEAYERKQKRLSDAFSSTGRDPGDSRPSTAGAEQAMTPRRSATIQTPGQTPPTAVRVGQSPDRRGTRRQPRGQEYSYQTYPSYPLRDPTEAPGSKTLPMSEIDNRGDMADLSSYPFAADASMGPVGGPRATNGYAQYSERDYETDEDGRHGRGS